MFADYISDSSWNNRPHRGMTTLASFALQFAAVGVLLLLPFIYHRRASAVEGHC
jgi:hypothetical protein